VKIRLAFAAMAAMVSLAFAAAPVSAADKDCADFKNWQQAQRFYKKHGGPKYDPHRLDADHDGIACEDLRY
jgi:Spy/CpxP family protein refolding chaperone